MKKDITKKKILLAFEYGIILSAVSKTMNIELTKEIIIEAEKMIDEQFSKNDVETIAKELEINVLSCLNTNTQITA